MNSPAFRPPFLTLAVTFALTLAVQAHPGHDCQDASARHLLTSADHVAVLALGGAALFWGARSVHDRLPRHVLQGVGIAVVAAAMLIWGMRA